jgi:hypothetical protein
LPETKNSPPRLFQEIAAANGNAFPFSEFILKMCRGISLEMPFNSMKDF